MSLVMRKPDFCICENKDADQLRGNREADQRLCFRYTDSTIPLLSKSENSSLRPSFVAVQPGLCRTWSEIPKTVFLTTRLICGLEQLFQRIPYMPSWNSNAARLIILFLITAKASGAFFCSSGGLGRVTFRL